MCVWEIHLGAPPVPEADVAQRCSYQCKLSTWAPLRHAVHLDSCKANSQSAFWPCISSAYELWPILPYGAVRTCNLPPRSAYVSCLAALPCEDADRATAMTATCDQPYGIECRRSRFPHPTGIQASCQCWGDLFHAKSQISPLDHSHGAVLTGLWDWSMLTLCLTPLTHRFM